MTYGPDTWTLAKQAQNKLAAVPVDQNGKKYVQHHIQGQEDQHLVRERQYGIAPLHHTTYIALHPDTFRQHI